MLARLHLLFVFALSLPAAPSFGQESAKSLVDPQAEDVVMVRVGPDAITVDDFMAHVAARVDRIADAATPNGKAELLRALIGERLLRQAMTGDGLVPENPTPEHWREALVAFADKHYPLPPVPDDQVLEEYYREHRNDFGIPETVRVTQIQFRVPDNATEDQISLARARADAAMARLRAGEPFGELASQLTENPAARDTGGDLGFLPKQADPWLEAALKGLDVGEHGSVVESPAGFEILMVTDQRDAIISPFEQVKEYVARIVQTSQQEKARNDYIRELAAKTEIVVELDELKDQLKHPIFP
jgi:parvulin-like peptidyl-prolyl isomerase